jgi:HEAT repeat protein
MLPLVERLKTQRRVDKSDLVEKIETMLVGSPSGIGAIGSAIAGANDVSIRRSIARLALTGNLPLAPIERAASDRDMVVRTQFALAVANRGTIDELERWLPLLFADKAPRIRSLAFRTAESKLPAALADALERFLFDGNFWLREFARQKLGREPRDFARTYAEAIAKLDPSTLGAAIAGLGEVGTPEDAAQLVPHIKTGKSRTRQLALRAVFNLLKGKAVPTLAESLGSASAGLSKVAAELLLTRGLIVFADDVLPHVQAASPHVRANALRTLAGIDKWEALAAALQCATDPDERVVAAAQRILALWEYLPAVLYSGPNAGQRERLRAALAASPLRLEALRRTMGAILRS